MRKDLSALAEHLSAIRNMLFWVSKMAQWVKAASAGKTDDLGSIPGTHMVELEN